MRYLSVCSGIEAPTVAWHPLGWAPAAFSEIEAFPRAVLAHHYPDVPCHGDFTTIGADDYGPIDLLVGGTPCQSFSVAGLRGGLADERGNLALEFLRLLDRKRPRWMVWENVPGVLSSLSHDAPDLRPPDIDLDGDDAPEDGQEVVVADEYDADESHALACFLAGLSELGYGWAYRVLDAQYAGVPQRRRRVFVVGHIGDWRRAAAVLFERHSLSGNPPPCRQAREGAAAGVARSLAIRGRDGTPQAELGDELANAILTPNGGRAGVGVGAVLQTFDRQSSGEYGTAPVASRVSARDYKGVSDIVAHSLRAEGFDASEDGTGRGTPLVPVAYNLTPSNSNKDFNAREARYAQALTGSGGRPSARGGDLIAFTAKDHGADASDISPTLRSDSHSGSHANGGVMPAVAFAIQERAVSENLANGPQGKGYQPDCAYTLEARNKVQAVATSAVRRLTPRECERLQGFPDDYTAVPYRGKPAADGPRYKALGNSMAVPVMRWIGERIAAVEVLSPAIERAA